MRRPPSVLIAVTAAFMSVIMIAGSEAKVHGASAAQHGVAPSPDGPEHMAHETWWPVTLPIRPASGFEGLTDRALLATQQAAAKDAELSVLVLDRETGRTASNGQVTPIVTASVVKLFIADDLLQQHWPLSPEDRAALDAMLRSSDDNAGEDFWWRGDGADIVTRVAERYGLRNTFPPPDGQWWNTITDASDLVRYYDMLLDGTGGLSRDKAAIIIGDLAESTPLGIDGYPQRFGIPDGLYREQVAVKQGWMCCIGPDWMHLSTGIVDGRYIMVVESREPGDDTAARDTITEAVRTMFPDGRI